MKNYNLIIFYLVLVLSFSFSISTSVFGQEQGQMQRIGCICRDGVRQNSTGAGACSGHKGVKYWLYADVGICQQYASDLPAIPDSDLIQLTPEEARRIAKNIAKEVTETLPILYDGDKKTETELIEKEREELEELREENNQKKEELTRSSNRFEVLDFFIPFVMVLVVILLFLLIVMVIKKVL